MIPGQDSKPYGRDNPLWGKYKAICRDHHDPVLSGRIRVECPSVFGSDWSDWCLPCLPPGLVTIPPEGQEVWIEFEGGDPERPVWSGVFYAGITKSKGSKMPWQETSATPKPGSKDASDHAKDDFDHEEHQKLRGTAHPPYYDPDVYGFVTPGGMMIQFNDKTGEILINNKKKQITIKPDGIYLSKEG